MTADERKGFVLATATLVGTIIGVGIFGVPYAMSQVGLWPALGFVLALGAIQILQSLFYGEAAIACDERVRLVGLAERYLGHRTRHIAAAASVLGFWGGLIAYVIVGGTFLHLLLSPWLGGAPFHYQVAWGVIGAAVVYFGLGFVEKIDFVSTVALVLALLLIVGMSAPHVRLDNFLPYVAGDIFLPYGVILFSLSGVSAIPEMEDVLSGRHKHFRLAIVVGMIVAAVLTTLFGLMVYGVTGMATTQDAMTGLDTVMGGGIAAFAAAFGFLAVATSYFIIGLNLRSTFEFDYKMHAVPAWLLAVGVPLGIVMLGVKNFITIVGFSGAVFGGVTAVIISLLYISITKKKLIPKGKRLGVPIFWANVTIVVLSLGALYEVVSTLKEMI